MREKENNEIKNEIKNEIWNKHINETNTILEKVDVNLTTLKLRRIFCGKPYNFIKKKKELRLLAKEEINKIEGLKEEVENKEDELLDYLLDGKTKVSKLLTDLQYEKIETWHNITVLESKLIKLEISPERIDRIKNSVL